MLAWWSSLSEVSKIFSAVAIPATVIMLLQTLLLFFGVGADADFDGDGIPDDVGDDGFSMFSVRALVAFFSVGGWAGLVADTYRMPLAVSIAISLSAGAAAFLVVALLFKKAMKLQDSGNIELSGALGKTGRVYIPVPPKGEGRGKINLTLQNRLCEIEAVCEEETSIPTGESVVVLALCDSETVVVGRLHTDDEKNVRGGISKWNLE